MHRFSNEIFKELMKIPENKKCFDCDKISCQWASINNGIFLCTNCSGIHRGLGVDKSYIRSILWDNWSDNQLEFMKQGGNKKLKDFLKLYSFDIKPISAQKFYQTKIMEYYRKDLKNKVEGNPVVEILPSREEAFENSDDDANKNNEDKYSSIGSLGINNDIEQNDLSFQNNIKNWFDKAYEGTKDTINNLELGNKIVNVTNSILDTGNKFIEKAQIKSYFSSYYNWIWGNNNTNSEINESQNYNNNKNIIEYKNNNVKDNNKSKENINNDININYNFENK